MDFYGRKNLWKFILFLFAALIGVATLWYTENFLEELRKEEVKKVELWSSAMTFFLKADKMEDLRMEPLILASNSTIPMIITDEEGNVMHWRNVNETRLKDPMWLKEKIEEMQEYAEPLEIDLGDGQKQYLYYQNSTLLTKLRYYPIVLLVVIALFVIIAYIAFSNARRAEQNQVWNGLAKETAHQIGTPLTSMMGWIELLSQKPENETMVVEMQKDIERLNTITQRFSKIGSQPAISPQNIVELSEVAVAYLESRSPGKVNVTFHPPAQRVILVNLNKPLFEWVVENLIRNAIDALEGNAGRIDIRLYEHGKFVRLDVEDTGKGIPPKNHKTIFRPGFTTKSRGWGLGLSLARRIIEDYHQGRIFVASSELGKGTVFRVQLKKVN